METTPSLDQLAISYSKPSEEAIEVLRESGLVVVGNELAGSGKDYLITNIIELPGSKYGRVPSRKTRTIRPGEVEGIDMVHAPMEEAVKDVRLGKFIEWMPFRGTDINGTHIAELQAAIESGIKPIKDVEPRGQVALRELNPELRAVYPLPDLDNWLEMLKSREALPGEDLAAFVAGDFSRDDLPEEPEGGWIDYFTAL
jgi:guanylate kinase